MAEIIKYEHGKLDEISKRIYDFGIKHVVASFDEENYLFTDYIYSRDMNAILTVENHIREKLYVSDCNCGYGGRGPSNTENLLTAIGVPAEMAGKLSYCDGFKLEYDENNELLQSQTEWGLPFVSRSERCNQKNIFFDRQHMAANLGKKQLYFIQPRGKSYQSLLRCLDILDIEKICVYIGNHNSKYFTFDIPYNLALKYKNNENILNGAYVYIEADPFDIIYLVGNESPASMINAIYYYLTEKVMFLEKAMGKLIVSELVDDKMHASKMRAFRPISIVKQLLLGSRKTQELYHLVDLKKGKYHEQY